MKSTHFEGGSLFRGQFQPEKRPSKTAKPELISDVNTGSVNPPSSGLTASYRALLSSEVYASNFADMQVDLGGLTNGTAYRVQLWINDSSVPTYGGSPYFENVIASGSSTNVVLDSNPSGTVGSLGQFVIGTFTANGTTASFTLTGSGTGLWKFPMMNALQVRAVPEPSTGLMTLLVAACGGVLAWRRRSGTARA